MNSDKIAKWLPNNLILKEFYNGIEEFSNEYINIKINENDIPKEKAIIDPIIGYIHLYPWEVSLIDTKIFQRLRKIKQLGLAYLVFPSLGYSRFEHTIGVLGRLIEVINKLSENHNRIGKETEYIKISNVIEKYIYQIRLSALFHDVGHCIYSHVSEKIITDIEGSENYPSVKDIRKIFTKHFKKGELIPISEIFAICILGTSKFKDSIKQLMKNVIINDIDNWIETIARFIIGLPDKNDTKTLFLAQIINSGLDIDKIDYMTREAYFTGIKLSIDIERIFDKMKIYCLKISLLPKYYNQLKKEYKESDEFYILGLDKGGQFAFEEFCISRVSLYEKIYLHQKVRAAESQLKNYLEKLPEECLEYRKAHRWLYLKEAYVECQEVRVPFTGEDLFTNKIMFSKFKLDDIENRNLNYRAFAFGPANNISDPVRYNENNEEILPSQRLLKDISENKNDLKYAICEEIKIICKLLEKDEETKNNEIIIDIPKYVNVQQGQDTIYFEHPNRLPLRWTMPIDKIIEYYIKNKALAYIFTEKKIAYIALLASEKVLWERSNSIFVQEGSIQQEIVNESEKYRKKLSNLGYYNLAKQLKPISDNLKTAENQYKIQKIEERLRQFESYNGDTISVSRITTYISQYPENIQDVALKMLEKIDFIDYSILKREIKKYVDYDITKRDKNIALVPLGGIGDSANHMMYNLREEIEKDIIKLELLNDNVVFRAEKIIFFDDNVNSGRQVLNIFSNWLSIKLPKKIRKGNYVEKLGDKAIERLKNMPIILIFCVGLEGIEEKLKNSFEKYFGIKRSNLTIQIGKRIESNKKVFTGEKSEFKNEDELKKYVKEIGTILMNENGFVGKDAVEKAYGYNKAEALVIFPYNVPTMTLPIIWANGKVNNEQWLPLAERRRRQ